MDVVCTEGKGKLRGIQTTTGVNYLTFLGIMQVDLQPIDLESITIRWSVGLNLDEFDWHFENYRGLWTNPCVEKIKIDEEGITTYELKANNVVGGLSYPHLAVLLLRDGNKHSFRHYRYDIVNTGFVTASSSSINYIKECHAIPSAEGKIIAHNINKLPCPDCGEAKEGQEIEVIMGMKNMGSVEGEFRFYIYDQDGNELSKEPDMPIGPTAYKNVKPGATWGVHKTLLTNLNFEMLNKTLNGRVELRRQT